MPGRIGHCVGPGATIIRAEAEDDGNIVHAEALLSVDSVPPVITANDVSAEATSAAGATVSFAFSAVDDLDPNPTVTADHVSGATYPIGTTNVLVTATDAAGNSSTKTLHVVVADATPPTLTLSGNITTDATSPAGVVVTYSNTATDIVSGAVAVNCVVVVREQLPESAPAPSPARRPTVPGTAPTGASRFSCKRRRLKSPTSRSWCRTSIWFRGSPTAWMRSCRTS